LFAQAPGPLSITISNIYPVEGDLYIAIYDNDEDYMEIEQAAFQKIAIVQGATQTIVISEVPEGEYAVSVFHDLNGNGELDTNAIGIPGEPYGFSNDARGRFGPPKFKYTKFAFPGIQEISIKLVNNDKD
jgi:uncharacterized protein (DUF2141 family)